MVKVGYFGYVIVKLYLFNYPQDSYLPVMLKIFTKLNIKLKFQGAKMIEKLKKFFLSVILRRKYYRTGQCNACGQCCSKIYVKHYKHVVTDEKEFERLQYLHRFYTYLKVVDKDDIGLVFECINLDPETKKCRIHKKRPGICRRYPQEELFSMGGALSENCGYRMEPIVPFAQVLDKLKRK